MLRLLTFRRESRPWPTILKANAGPIGAGHDIGLLIVILIVLILIAGAVFFIGQRRARSNSKTASA
jgi:hypothetical protein